MARPRAVVVATLLAAASVTGWWLGAHEHGDRLRARVLQVVDGDTVVVELDGHHRETVRLLGVDTPETVHPDEPVQCFGPEASAFTKARLTRRWVELEVDVERRDRYGRLLAYVYLDGRRFNDMLLERGYARLLVIPPNGAHARTMLADELDARHRHRGLWAACGERPGR